MGKPKSLQRLIGNIKDRATQSKATIIHIIHPNTKSIHLALLRTTTHDSHTPPDLNHLGPLLSAGTHSRAAVAAAMWRLRATRDACVAVKCLITIHHLIKHGGAFRGLLDDHLFLAGGRNVLKLNHFRDNSSSVTLELSPWVRWYALYLDCLLFTTRFLGFFPNLTPCSKDNSKEKEHVSSLETSHILRQTDAFVRLLEEICQRPQSPPLYQNKIIDEIRELVAQDYFATLRLVMVRLGVFIERLMGSGMSYNDSNDLAHLLKRLEDCKKGLLELTHRFRVLVEDFWDLVCKVRSKVGNGMEEKMLVIVKTKEHNLSKWDE